MYDMILNGLMSGSGASSGGQQNPMQQMPISKFGFGQPPVMPEHLLMYEFARKNPHMFGVDWERLFK